MKIFARFLLFSLTVTSVLTMISCTHVTSRIETCRNIDVNELVKEDAQEDSLTKTNTIDIMKFNLSDFEWEIENCSCELNIGPVENADYAVEKAIEIWQEKFGENIGGLYEIIKDHRILVAFDDANNCWHVNGGYSQNQLSAVPHVLIKTDGTVLAIWIG